MERKLIKQGSSTLMVSLPSKWIKRYQLTKGSTVILEEDNAQLLLRAGQTQTLKETNFDITISDESLIRTMISNAYRAGNDKITLRCSNKEQEEIALQIVKTKLIGFEVSSHKDGVIKIENLTEPSFDSFDSLFEKIFLNISLMFDEYGTAWKTGELRIKEIEEIEERIQKYDNYCRRAVTKNTAIQFNREFLWLFMTLISHAQREMYVLRTMKIKNQELCDYLGLIRQIFDQIHLGYTKRDIKLVLRVHEMEKNVVRVIGPKILAKGKSDAVATYYLMGAARRFYQANSPLIGMLVS